MSANEHGILNCHGRNRSTTPTPNKDSKHNLFEFVSLVCTKQHNKLPLLGTQTSTLMIGWKRSFQIPVSDALPGTRNPTQDGHALFYSFLRGLTDPNAKSYLLFINDLK
jgi:hypothetical protein